MDFFSSSVRFFQDGGFIMYFILGVFALGLAIAIERYVFLTSARNKNREMWDKLLPVLKRGEYKAAQDMMSQSSAAICNILSYGLSRVVTSRRHDDVETAMEEGLLETVPRLEKRTHYLTTFANVSTLLGLLGTVIGLIDAFTAVSSANPSEKAALLSASISVGMNSTAFGLMVAIPLLLIYSVLQSKTVELVDSLEMASVKVLNIIKEHSDKQGSPQ